MESLDRPREADAEQVTDPRGAAFTAALAGMARGHGLTVTELSGTRFKVAAGPDGRGLEVKARQRADDGSRWWFCWGGTVWLCEADKPADALMQIKGALRRIVSPWSQPDDCPEGGNDHRVAVGRADNGRELEVGKHDGNKEKDGKWDKPIPPKDPKNPPGGGKHEKGK